MNLQESEEILKVIDRIKECLHDMPDFQDEIVSMNEKMDINNQLLLLILDKLNLKKENE